MGPATPRRRGSRILWRYLAGQFAIPLCCCLAGFAALFAVLDILDVLDEFMSAKAPPLQVVWYFLLQQACNLPHVLPMSLLLSASFVVSSMGRHHEVTAVRAVGVSLPHWFLPFWVAGLIFSGFSFWFNEKIIPGASARVEILRERLEQGNNARAMEKKSRLAFRNAAARRTWFFSSVQDKSYNGVLLKQFRENLTVAWEIRAARAEYADRSWMFHQATVVRYDEAGELPAGPEERHALYSNPEITETPEQITNSMRPVEELTIRQMRQLLRQRQNLPARLVAVFETTIWHRRMLPLSCLVAVLLGCTMAVARENNTPLKGLSTALGIMVAYYLAMQFFVLLGKHGLLPPPLAGILPTLGFLLWGGLAAYRRR